MKCVCTRFSVRTLAIFVTLVCAYFGAWEATKTYGATEESESSPMPFVVSVTRIVEYRFTNYPLEHKTRYSLWLFGPKIKLPFESKWVDP